ncbi:MAG: insulinase family protein [Bryobacterales bacterium]|nr:insulinase family protein [Bryobacterales bacterium]
MRSFLLASLFSLLPASSCLAAQPAAAALPKGVAKVASVEGITEYRLDNGMKVLLFPDDSKPKVTVNVTFMVGSKHENYGETGMAHLLEHLVFKGTQKRTNIIDELGKRGADFNGTTSMDRTNYFETLPASDDNLRWALEMEADRMVNSRIAKSDLDTEMTVVRNEFEMGENNPGGVLFQRVMNAAYDWHNYGKTTIGNRSDIENVPIDRLQAFYRKYYQPDKAMLVIAGKFDQAKALAMVAELFGPIPRPERKLDKLYTAEPTQDGERTVQVRRVGDTQMVITAHHIPPGTHTDFAPMEVLEVILGDTPTGRLYKALVDNKKAAGVIAGSFQVAEPGLLFFGAQVNKDKSMPEAREALLRTIEGAVKEPPTAEEVERAKTKMLKQFELGIANSERIGVQLSEWQSMADWRMMFIYRDRLKEVKPADVQRVAAKYLKEDNRTVGVFVPIEKPDRTDVPAPPDITKLVSEYKGGAGVEAGEVFDPTPANVEARVERLTLPSGMKLVLMPRKTRGGIVMGRVTLRHGDEKSLFGKSRAASFTWSMLNRGTSKHSRQQIQEEFDKLKAQVGINGSAQFGSATINTVRANFPATLRLVAEIYKEPAFPETEFEQVKLAAAAQVENMMRDPQFLAFNELGRHGNTYPRGDVRYTGTAAETLEDIKKATLEDVRGFYKSFFGASNAAVMTVIGDFDPAEVKKLAAELFGDWKSPSPVARVTRPYKAVPAVVKSIETPDKANAMFAAGFPIQMSDEHADYPALLMANHMFGGGAAARLFVRMRQKEGWSYGAGSQLSAPTKDDSGSLVAYAILAPENMAKLEAGFQEEIKKAVTEGFTEAEFNQHRAAWLQEQKVNRAEDMALLGMLSGNEYWGRTMKWQGELEAKVEALTVAQVNAAAKKYWDPAKLAVFKAGDFAKVAAKAAAGAAAK